MSYHKLKIHKHSIESPYKIQEEFMEYIDSIATGNSVMAVQELSDLYGCLEREISKFGMSVAHLKIMSDLTSEVFNSGIRTNEALLKYLKREYDSILNWGTGFIQVKCGDINYNFYHKGVHKFGSSESPHSHQKDFISEVVKGRLTEKVYLTEIDNSAKVKAYPACGNLFAEELSLSYFLDKVKVYEKGALYLRLKEEFHSVSGEHGTVTKVMKYGSKSNAYVIAQRESEMIQHIPELACWRMVEECLNV